MDELQIIRYSPQYATAFKTLNIEWLQHYFVVEPIDVTILENPEEQIISKGGEIIFAKVGNDIVGTCALKKQGADEYELTKMAVAPRAQGLQIGKKLGLAMIALAREKAATKVFLESNRKLLPALNLYAKLGFVEKKPPFTQSAYTRADIYMELEL